MAASPFPFVAGAVLTAAQLNTFGDLTTYTPTFVNVTVGNGTLDFEYFTLNEVCFVKGTFTLGSTSSVAGGGATMSLPVTSVAIAGNPCYGVALMQDTSGDRHTGTISGNSTTTVKLNYNFVSGTSIVENNISAASPFTWVATDRIHVAFWYEIA
jgi:hypothetical protein